MGSEKKITLLKHLLERRFPQIIFIYFGVCWTILEFISWVVEHYTISPYIIDFSFVTLISLIPTVGLLAYFHGKPGPDNWNKIEKIGIPVNLVITIVLLVSLFSGKELGSTTTDMYLEDELGTEVSRVVPKKEFTKRLAIFFFENESGNPDLDWLQSGIMFGCHMDLLQDPFFSLYSAYDYLIYQQIQQAGFRENIDVPIALEKQIAREIQRKYFVGGSFTVSNDTFIVNSYLYETDHGRLISERQFRATDIFSVIDHVAIQIKKDLRVPLSHNEDINDLPAAEIITRSVPAFREMILAQNAINFGNDHALGVRHFEKSVELDPTFAVAHWGLYTAYMNTSRSAKAIGTLQATMQHIYRLPETLRFRVKEEYYLVTEDPEKRITVLKMWAKLYPKNVNAHFALAQEYLNRRLYEDAISEYNTILSIDPERYYYLRYIGNIYLEKGNFKEALKYYLQHQKKYPNDYRSFMALGELYFKRGEYEKAREHFLKAQIIEPKATATLTRLADISIETGDFPAALRQYEEALIFAVTPEQRAGVFAAMTLYYERTGRIRQALEYREKQFTEEAQYRNPVEAQMEQLLSMSFHNYVIVKRDPEALARIGALSAALGSPWSKVSGFAYLDIYMQQRDDPKISTALTAAAEAERIFGGPRMRYIHHAAGILSEIRGDYVDAILNYQKELQCAPTEVSKLVNISRCYRELGDFARAEKFLETTLKILPYYPDAQLEMARICFESGEYTRAQQHLAIALQIWENADSDYPSAREARELRSKIPVA